jgi:type IV secretion system protein VirB10
MIPKKGPDGSQVNSTLDNDITRSEAQAKEDVKNSKPALYKSIAMRGLQYVSILAMLLSIGYKMFFSGVDEDKKSSKIKKPKKTEQDNLSKKEIKVQGKATVPEKIKMIDSDRIADEEMMKSIKMPDLQPPVLPTVPMIEKIVITEEKKETEPQDSRDTDNNISTQEKKDTLFAASPLSSPEDKKEKDSKDVNQKDTSKSAKLSGPANKKNEIDAIKSAMEEMFVLSGQGPAIKDTKQRSSSKDDIIIFDGSSISIREVSNNDNIGMKKINNLDTTIATGKVIEATLETAINSEMPGMVRAVVSKDVVGEMGNRILIPRGSRLYGTYSSSVNHGQTRLAITWNKVLRPDGFVVSIDAQVADQFGRTGIEGDVDSRYFEMFQNSLLLSFITLGTAVALEKVVGVSGQNQVVNANGSVATTNITPANAAAQSIITTASDIAKKMSEGLMEKVKPVISIPQGMLLNVMVNQDITLPVYKRKKNNFDY